MTIQNALAELSTLLGQRIGLSKSDLDLHGRSEAHFSPCPPDAVVYPETTQEVSRIVKICAAHGVPVTGWGAGTSIEGQNQPVNGGVVVDFQRMNRILAVHQGDMDVVVQPGVTREALNEDLRATGLFFPVDPGANASLGGMASTRASGTTAVRYGTMRDNVLALEVVLADGRIIRTGSRARKSSSGYDLTGLFVGSEGTLGLITELTLRVQGQPEAITAAICAFPTVGNAVNAVMDTIQVGLAVARIELVDTATVAAFNSYAKANMPAQPHLLLEFHGSPAAVEEATEQFGDIAEDHGATGFEWASNTEDRNALWAMRHNAYFAILANRPGAQAITTDICIPISQLALAVEETIQDLEAHDLNGPILGHVGDGNFHSILLFDPENDNERTRAFAAADRMVERALTLGGTITGEHGIGRGKLGYMEREHGDAWDIMTDIKTALDPSGVFNPGKLVRQNHLK
ncbi:MAG: 2-hydroxy-acid oxidase [Rhodobacterales bacterium]|nr:MAG: 2-hydroxy-acid oxidase [Rhodobacterales bacterium]